MRWIVGASVNFRLLVLPLAVLLLGIGIVQLRSAPVDVLPEVAPTRVQIQTEALGLSAVEVEQLITVPLEQDLLNGVAWLDEIHSVSVAGLSSVELIFEPGTNVLRARQVVQERLTQAHGLPQVSGSPTMLQPLSTTNRLLMVGLTATDVSAIDMSVLARWRIKPRLLGVPGVANVSIWGQRERQLQVLVDPERLRTKGVTLNQVIETTGNALWVSPLTFVEASTPGTGGFIDTPNQRLGIRHVLPITTPEDLSRVIVEEKKLRLGDVATVVEDHQPLIGDAVVDGGPGLMLVIEKFPGASTADVTRDVEAALDSMAPGLAGIKIDTSLYRPASYVDAALDGLSLAVLLGGLIVLLLLVALFFSWRTALISAAAIPLSLTIAGLVLTLQGVTFNGIILAGLMMAVAVIVSDAIVDTEHIARRVSERKAAEDGRSIAQVIINASLEVRGPLIFATLMIAAAAAPLLLRGGVTGALLSPLASSYLWAVLASFAVALTVTPALAMLVLSPGRKAPNPVAPWIGALSAGYRNLLSRVVGRSSWTIGVAAVLIVAGVAALPWLGGRQLLPRTQDRDVVIAWEAVPGTSRPEMIRVTEQAIQELKATAGVRNVGAHLGRAITSDQVVDINSGEIWVNIDPEADYPATTEAIRDVVNGYAGMIHTVSTFPEAVAARERPPAGADIVVRVYGQDLAVLQQKADQVRQLVSGVDGTANATVEQGSEEPTIQIEVDLARAEAHGIKPGDVRRAAATLLSGVAVGNLFEEQKVFDVVVWGDPSIRQNPAAVRNLLIDTPQGGHVKLGDVADVRIVSNPTGIRHEAVSRYLDVSTQVQGRAPGAVAADIADQLKKVEFPVEYHAEMLGNYAQRQDDRRESWWFGLAAAIAIFLLLQACFSSWRLAIALFLPLPMALAGGVLAAGLLGAFGSDPSSMAVLAGLLVVLAVTVRDMVLLVRTWQRTSEPPPVDEQPTGRASLTGTVLRGSQERLPATLWSLLTIGLALTPLLFLGNRPGFEFLRPMSIVIIGGLLTSALFNLFVVPALYARFGHRSSAAAIAGDGRPVQREA